MFRTFYTFRLHPLARQALRPQHEILSPSPHHHRNAHQLSNMLALRMRLSATAGRSAAVRGLSNARTVCTRRGGIESAPLMGNSSAQLSSAPPPSPTPGLRSWPPPVQHGRHLPSGPRSPVFPASTPPPPPQPQPQRQPALPPPPMPPRPRTSRKSTPNT